MDRTILSHSDEEYPWEREARLLREKQEEEQLRIEREQNDLENKVFEILKFLYEVGKCRRANMLAHSHQRLVAQTFGESNVLASVRAESRVARAFGIVIARLRQAGSLGVIGFSGTDVDSFVRFVRTARRVDLVFFPLFGPPEFAEGDFNGRSIE